VSEFDDLEAFDAVPMFGALAEHGVRYVVIGGLAAVLHGSPQVTHDVDICPARDRANLEQLSRALQDLNARIRSADNPDGHAARIDADFMLAMAMVNLKTDFGWLDISFEPAGTDGYEDLASHAVTFSIGGVLVPVASLDDVIRSKETANRQKDNMAMPTLYALRDEIAKRQQGDSEG
jgi:hypothetical protein